VLLAVAASGSGVAAAASHDIRVNATGSLLTEQGGICNILHSVPALSVAASSLVWLATQVPRYRRAVGERRQQLKWLYSGAVVFVVSVSAAAQASGNTSGPANVVSNLITPLGFAAFAVCRRPPVQPGALQRRGDRGHVHRAAAPDRRPRHGTRRPGGRGR
jgi:hypothetical protein